MRIFVGIIALVLSGHLMASESFLEESELATLAPHPDVAGVMRHVSPGVELGSYNKLLFGGVTLYFDDSSKSKDIDADEAKHISDAMKVAMEKAAVGDVVVATEPGAATALFNVAITEINIQKKKRGLLGYTPVGFVVTTAGDAAGMRMQLKDANIEGELVDSVTGDVLAIFRVDDVPAKDGKRPTWDDVTAVFQTLLQQGIIASRD